MNTCQKLTSSANSFSTPPKKYTRRHSPLPGFLLEQILSSSTTTWQQFLLQHSLLLSPGPFRTPTEIPCPWLREAQHTWSLPLHYTIPPLFHTSPNNRIQPALGGRQAALVQGTLQYSAVRPRQRQGALSPWVRGRHDWHNTARLLRYLFPRVKGGRHPLTQRKPCTSALGCQG